MRRTVQPAGGARERAPGLTTEEGWRQCMDDVLQFLLAAPFPRSVGRRTHDPQQWNGGVYVPVRISGTSFRCESHERHFEATLTMSERADAKVECPTCGTAKVHPHLTVFTAKTSRKS